MKKAGSADASSEEDFVLTSPMEIVTQQDIILSDAENKVSLLLGGIFDSDKPENGDVRMSGSGRWHLMTLQSSLEGLWREQGREKFL